MVPVHGASKCRVLGDLAPGDEQTEIVETRAADQRERVDETLEVLVR